MLNFGLSTKVGVGLSVLLALTGCHSGGAVTSSPSLQNPSALVISPIIAFPGLSPYYSSASSLNLSGGCMNGYVVTLTGSLNSQQTCTNSTFSFPLTEAVDGVYTFVVTQSNSTTTVSTPATFVWVKASTVAPPVVTYPAASPFSSALPLLTISGSCQTGATVSLTGDGTGSATCTGSAFSIALPKAVDGDYTIGVLQTDAAGNTASTSVVWKKHALAVSPASPATLQVGVVQPLTITGGSGTYNVAQTTNGSSGTLGNNLTYSVGPLANATDVLTVTDSLGVSSSLTITTTAGSADHFLLPALSPVPSPTPAILTASQVGAPGQLLGSAVKVQVVDRYNNGVSGYPVVFQNLIGDSMITTKPLQQTSDANGYAQINLKLGFSSVINQILVKPVSGTLPDIAGSLAPVLVVTEESLSKNTGALGSTFATGNGPGAFAVGLFNTTDSYPDIAVLNQSSVSGGPYVSIMLGIGNGMFKTQSTGIVLPTCTSPAGIASGIFRSSTHLVDLVMVCSSSNVLEIALGNGDGTFVTPTVAAGTVISTANFESGPTAVAVADFDGDGNLDIAVVGAASKLLGIRYGNGNGTFSAIPNTYALGAGANSVVTGNFHSSVYPDIAVSNGSSGTISLFFNSGTSRTFAVQTVLPAGGNATGLTSADYNNDGWGDLAVANSNDNTIDVYINDGTGNFTQTFQPNTGNNPAWLTSGDFNGDGYMDMAVTNYGDATVTVFLGNGTGNLFTAQNPMIVEGEPTYIGTSDVDKNGQTDLILVGLVDQVVQVIPNQGAAVFGYAAAVGTGPIAGVSADFNNDGLLDAAVLSTTSDTVTILEGKAVGFSSKTVGFMAPYATTLAAGTSPVAIAVADLNVDGSQDLIIVNNKPAGSIRVFLGQGNYGFNAYTDYQTNGAYSTALTVQDFNGDGFPDVAVTNTSSSSCSGNGSVSIFINKADGTGALLQTTTICVGQSPMGIVASDFNGDHKIDLAIANQGDSSVVVLLGNGNGTFQNYGLEYATGSGPVALVAADFDNDGKMDVATADQAGSTVSILKGSGSGSFAAANSFSVATPSGLVVADFNGDLLPDLLVLSGTSNSATLLFNAVHYANAFNSQTPLQTGVNTPAAILGDFNKDGAIDAIFIDATHAQISTRMGH